MPSRLLPRCAAGALLALATATATAAAPAPLPATLEAALAGAETETAAGLAFDHTVEVRKDGTLLSRKVMRHAPDAQGVLRCTVVAASAPEGETPDSKPGDRCDSEEKLPTYADLAAMLRRATVTALAETPTEARYRVEPRAGERLSLGGVKIQYGGDGDEDLVGTLRVLKPAGGPPHVAGLTLALRQPAGNLLARVRKLEIAYAWGARDAAVGQHLPRAFDVTVDVLLGGFYALETRVEQRYAGFRRVPRP